MLAIFGVFVFCHRYSIYKALAVAQGTLDPDYMPKLSMTQPVVKFGPFPSWSSEEGQHKIVSIDPFGHMPVEAFPEHLEKGFDIRPTIAVTKAHIDLPECKEAIRVGRLAPDGDVMTEDGQYHITKVNITTVVEAAHCRTARLMCL